MKKDITNVIIEGCFPDTPRSLMYAGIDLEIPMNVRMLLSDHPLHPKNYILYAKTTDFSTCKIENNPFFEFSPQINPNKLLKGGWLLNEQVKNFRWIFDAQRSLTTRDGRIYIQATYFQDKWRWYLDAVPTILRECGEIFEGRKDEIYYQNYPSRAW